MAGKVLNDDSCLHSNASKSFQQAMLPDFVQQTEGLSNEFKSSAYQAVCAECTQRFVTLGGECMQTTRLKGSSVCRVYTHL